MLPTQDKYPQFVPDQLLTSEHLNNLFNYLEEQGRMTRTNLIGIGVVCGLEVKIDSSSVTITKGCGVTSSGYLVTVPEKTYTHYKTFNPVKDIKYDRFVAADDTEKFHLDELKEAAVEEGTSPITAPFLNNKVVLIFVELLQEGAKNCDPNSCDDKGINITVTFRPLIIDAADAATLSASVAGSQITVDAINLLPQVKMRRFDVQATALLETADIFEAYRKILSATFLTKAKDTLTQSYVTLSPLVFDMYGSNPFASLPSDFSFLHDNDITDDQLVNIQYYYDLFSDLLLAYEELRRKGMELLCLCCPDEELFPRHLLLGRVSSDNTLTIEFRQYFIASPIHCNHAHSIQELRWLFRRLVLLIQKFSVPPPVLTAKNRRGADDKIRITPSMRGDVVLSKMSIPYYYKVAEGPNALYDYWNYFKALHGQSKSNLSYHADQYNTTDETVYAPLLYDIEPYNFLRIEGHIGKPYTHAVKNILSLRNKYRLPFEVIALSGNMTNLRTQLIELLRGTNLTALNQTRDESMNCHFADLEAQYETQRAELICILCKELKYYYAFPGTGQLPTPNSLVSQVSLLQYCDPTFQFTANTLGHNFELFYKNFASGYISADTWLNSFKTVTTGATVNNNTNIGLILMYYIVKLYEGMAESLQDFDFNEFSRRYDDLIKIAEYIKSLFKNLTGDNNNLLVYAEDLIDHLDALIYACKKAPMEALYKEYRLRWIYLLMLQRFGYYIKMHPGIQHKGGVPLGGTFILVYHEETVEPQTPTILATGFETGFSNIRTANTNFTANLRRDAASSDTSSAEANLSSGTGSGSTATINTGSINTNLNINNLNSLNIAGFNISRYTDRLKNLFIDVNRDDATIDDIIDEIADGTVIADFYLPYICCSDCPPIQFVINEKEEPTQTTIDIDAKEYCSDDKGPYSISVSPAGGTVTGEGTSQSADGNFIFTPSAVNLNGEDSKKVALTYDVDGNKATVEVVVYQKPTASFTASQTDNFNTVNITNNSKNGQTFAWDFGDGQTSDSQQPEQHSYKDPGDYVITLKVTNGICSSTTEQTVTIRTPEQVSINIDGKEFCSDDKTAYQVAVNPAGGKASGEGVKTASGKVTFTPATVKLDGAVNKKVTLSYAASGQTAQTEVIVYQMPNAAFQFTINAEKPLTVTFQNFSQFAEKFAWDFGDGKKSEEKDPTHQYEKAGTYVVTLQVTNGVCSTTFSQNVVLETRATEQKTCLPLEDLVTTFQKLKGVDTAAAFAQFIKNYSSYKDIEAFFKQLSSVISSNSDKQIAFFDDIRFGSGSLTNNIQLTFPQVMMQWMSELFNSFIFDAEDNTRLLALNLYRILENLAMYVECIQAEDIGKAKVDMNEVLQLIQRHLVQLAQMVQTFSKDKQAVVVQLMDDINAELTRLKNNNESTTKKAYVKALTSLADTIKSYKLKP